MYSDEEDLDVFLLPPIVSYRSVRKMKDYIVRSKLYLPEGNLGCEGCGNGRCQICKSKDYWYISQIYYEKKLQNEPYIWL